jgi:hypothetical protein
VESDTRPAFYALSPGGWRDYVTLLHPPYVMWHLSYVAIGAALAPGFVLIRLSAALLAFFLAVGLAAHALDELNGRPLKTRIPGAVLTCLAIASLLAAVAIGVAGAVLADRWLVIFVGAGIFMVFAYSLELAGGLFHNDAWFALFWGSFPLLTGYFAMAGTLDVVAISAAAFAFLSGLAQRLLSNQVRDVRRRVQHVAGSIERRNGAVEPITTATLIGAEEGALRMMSGAHAVLAAALVIMRLQ